MMKARVWPLDKKSPQPSDAGVVHFKRCLNPECRRPFRMSRVTGHASGFTDAGKLVCPHCGWHMPAQAASIYTSQAMSASEEREFDSWRPGDAVKH